MKNATFLSLFFLTLFTSCNTVTYLFISDQEEVELGDSFKEELLSDTEEYPVYTADASVVRYVDSIGQLLAELQQDRKRIDYTFTVIDKPDVINAFAIPGGHIFIYTGLIKAARNEAELAGVLAHELGHITKRHGIKRLISMYGVTTLLDIIIGDGNSGTKFLADITTSLAFLQYSQRNEYEADSLAVEYIHLAGYNPNGMKTFFGVLQEKDSTEVPWLLQQLSTHPPVSERIESVESVISRLSDADLSEDALFEERFLGYRGRVN